MAEYIHSYAFFELSSKIFAYVTFSTTAAERDVFQDNTLLQTVRTRRDRCDDKYPLADRQKKYHPATYGLNGTELMDGRLAF